MLICVVCLLAGLGALATANYLSVRSQAYSQLSAQSRALALSHTEALRDWVRAKAAIVQSSAAVLEEADPARYLNMLQKAGSFHTTYFGGGRYGAGRHSGAAAAAPDAGARCHAQHWFG